MFLVCWNHDCRQTYPASDFKAEQMNVTCTRCGDTVISPSGKVMLTGLPNVMPTIDPSKLKEEFPVLDEQLKSKCWDCEREVEVKKPNKGDVPRFVICRECQDKEEDV
ncbi:hypothetical protein CPT_Moonbeam111 [Bacillus phage Moonbeam]|uniref:Uncharacterized protein n=1 Tax=Bacillus phage Moonbeam TaxID=1540091 RepID=A0A0A0RPI3_9CAUD|nr:hypothetical protein CPT_Moonbeam111 [Bacillus phage Moonbeam]AIW03509.1 hypothetical protein CPT_Moonbeam111 [Bacillus phage Moonbeam]